MIGARLAMHGGSWKPTISAKSYIQDGLIAMWDGVENAGWGVHDANATAWKDLVGGLEFQIIGGVTVDVDAMRMGKDLVYTGGFKPIPYSGDKSNWFLEACLTYGQPKDISPIIVGVGAIDSSRSCPCLIAKNTYFLEWGYDYDNTNKVFVVGKKITVSASVNNGYANTIKLNPTATDTWPFGDAIYLAKYKDTTRQLENSSIHNVRIYNRALSEAEIAHNYAVDKERFGL